jgi:hypothetical protein
LRGCQSTPAMMPWFGGGLLVPKPQIASTDLKHRAKTLRQRLKVHVVPTRDDFFEISQKGQRRWWAWNVAVYPTQAVGNFDFSLTVSCTCLYFQRCNGVYPSHSTCTYSVQSNSKMATSTKTWCQSGRTAPRSSKKRTAIIVRACRRS